jgi:hypothetical protein
VRLSLRVIKSELERLGARAVLAKGDGYFYFEGGEAADWLDRTVRVPTLHSLALDQRVQEFQTLREQNQQMESVQKHSEESAQPAPKARPKNESFTALMLALSSSVFLQGSASKQLT